MKSTAIKLVWLTTLCLLAFVVLCSLGAAFPLLFCMLVACQGIFIYTVYRVLTDNYHTDKQFRDWYEDVPKKELYKL